MDNNEKTTPFGQPSRYKPFFRFWMQRIWNSDREEIRQNGTRFLERNPVLPYV